MIIFSTKQYLKGKKKKFILKRMRTSGYKIERKKKKPEAMENGQTLWKDCFFESKHYIKSSTGEIIQRAGPCLICCQPRHPIWSPKSRQGDP